MALANPMPKAMKQGGPAPMPSGVAPVDLAPKRDNFFTRILKARGCLAMLAIGLVASLFIFIPYWFWDAAPYINLKLAIVDKTVPFKDCREHRGLFWLLEQNKIVDSSRMMPLNKWDKKPKVAFYNWFMDYIGYHPINAPEEAIQQSITPQDLWNCDGILITDTYGVYKDDYKQFPHENAAATRLSPRIYGGIFGPEVDAIEAFLAQKKKFILAEFNTFATPTDPVWRARLENIFGVRWTGWCGRYFLDFTDEKDVPRWLVIAYEEKYKEKWGFRGSGYVIYNGFTNDMVFLFDDQDILAKGVRLMPRLEYSVQNVMQGVEPNTCNYWFDILEPAKGTQILADYEMDLTTNGRKKVLDAGLKLSFPAVTLRQQGANGYKAYYIAGDVVDFPGAMGPPHSRLTLYINRSYFANAVPGGAGCFFWHTYYPLLTNILRFESHLKCGQPEQPFMFH
jgi:hypothetical protein